MAKNKFSKKTQHKKKVAARKKAEDAQRAKVLRKRDVFRLIWEYSEGTIDAETVEMTCRKNNIRKEEVERAVKDVTKLKQTIQGEAEFDEEVMEGLGESVINDFKKQILENALMKKQEEPQEGVQEETVEENIVVEY